MAAKPKGAVRGDKPPTPVNVAPSDLAKPLHIQRLEKALDLGVFLRAVDKIFADQDKGDATDSSSSDSEADVQPTGVGFKVVNGIGSTLQDRKADKLRLYNFDKVKKDRRWLKNILLVDSSDESEEPEVTEDDFKDMLKMHVKHKKCRNQFYKNKQLDQYRYYSVGLLSNEDRFPEHQFKVVGDNKKPKLKKKDKTKAKQKARPNRRKISDKPSIDESFLRDFLQGSSTPSDKPLFPPELLLAPKSGRSRPRPKRRAPAPTEASLAAKRRKAWVTLAKKEVSKAQKSKNTAHKEAISNCKKLAVACAREVRKAALASQKQLKETHYRSRRLAKEMLLYWKKFEKVEKEHRRRAEREAQEQLKMDTELNEAKRQQRKLNFLITQTELYAHFMSRKIEGSSIVESRDRQHTILSQLDEGSKRPSLYGHQLIRQNEYDCEEMKQKAMDNAQSAYDIHMNKTKGFGGIDRVKTEPTDEYALSDPGLGTRQDRPQPIIFTGILKTYQLKGMNWLANLYDQGINGILADEMGLGKTIQSIAFLSHVAESMDVWGPFLIIAPSSTLHNWQQEFERFVPRMRVVPYWGTTAERRILRQIWSSTHKSAEWSRESSSFHVVITSYQLVVQDVKYFQRIRWQYMILDEAQAIKSSSSVRWKILLGFSCRNRLLLTGTPIQNSMGELWALLHFIMPTLFDSHDEFSEWFSKDIESHAENKSTMDEKHLSRLHMILKPFMLRRIKKDVENEMSDKIEILTYCSLMRRQKHLYEGLKQKISLDDLLHSYGSNHSNQSQTATSSLMNLVMQFRKVCNHPELFERRDVWSPYIHQPEDYYIPRVVFREALIDSSLPGRDHIFTNHLSIFHPHHVHSELQASSGVDSCFSFLRFVDWSVGELASLVVFGFLARYLAVLAHMEQAKQIHHNHTWRQKSKRRFMSRDSLFLVPTFNTSGPNVASSAVLSHLVFARERDGVYCHSSHTYHYRKRRLIEEMKMDDRGEGVNTSMGGSELDQSTRSSSPIDDENGLTSSALYVDCSKTVLLVPTALPRFLVHPVNKMTCCLRRSYSCDRSFAWREVRRELCGTPEALHLIKHGQPWHPVQEYWMRRASFVPPPLGGLMSVQPTNGWSDIVIPDKETLVTDSGKLYVLDILLRRLKANGHRVLIYSQMTRMIDIIEEYIWHRKLKYMRLDGSSKISDRRDMVADFQAKADIFVFLLSTRAGGLGINLTAADTVIFYDSDWNPTVDQQAMDRAHRLGQTKQVTVYRLICKGTIEERILQRAREKSEIQRMVISGGNFKPDTLKPTEVVSLLLDDGDLERKFREKQAESRLEECPTKKDSGSRKRKRAPNKGRTNSTGKQFKPVSKRPKSEQNVAIPVEMLEQNLVDGDASVDSAPGSPAQSELSTTSIRTGLGPDDVSVDMEEVEGSTTPVPETPKKRRSRGSTGRRPGRPAGGGRGGGRVGRTSALTAAAAEMAGAQAGLTAAYAAYGYKVTTPSVTPPVPTPKRRSRPGRSSDGKSGAGRPRSKKEAQPNTPTAEAEGHSSGGQTPTGALLPFAGFYASQE